MSGQTKQAFGADEKERTPGSADARVYDDDVDGAGREVGPGCFEGEGAGQDVLGRHAVGDIDDDGLGVDAQDDAAHGRDVGVARAEVGGEGDDRSGHR